MTKKEKFINCIQKEIFDQDFTNIGVNYAPKDWEDIKEFWEAFKSSSQKTEISEKGIKILKFMKENKDQYNNCFKAKDIGEGLFVSGRSISGSMRKLITDGFCEKIGADPVTYAITELGLNKELGE